jgi:hypothetical protein
MSKCEYRKRACRKLIITHKKGDIARPTDKATNEAFGIGSRVLITDVFKQGHGYIVKFSPY